MSLETNEHSRVAWESAAALVFVVVLLGFVSDTLVTRIYYLEQDRYVGLLFAAALAVLALRTPALTRAVPVPTGRMVWVLAAVLVAGLWAGTYWLMRDYPVTRDELMARFDAQILATGRAAMPVAEQWRAFTIALVPNFLEPVEGYGVWVSSYMPGHALLRALFGKVADPALLNPALAGIGLVALAGVARRLFPQQAGAQWTVIAGYVLCAQILTNTMTSYAMTAHIAVNCLWLLAFIKDRWWSHAAAMALGIVGIGLHQIIFHPLFVAPILLTLLPRRRFVLLGVYGAVYAAALAGWIGYHGWATGGIATVSGDGGGPIEFLLRRAWPLLTQINSYTVPLMLYNLLRFAVWMPVFVAPLALLAWPAVKTREGLAAPLLGGVVLTLVAMAWLQAFQGHGWGYRYMHGVIPNILLLAGMGYARWAEQDRARAQGFVAVCALATLPALALLAVTTRAFITPYAALSERIERQQSDFVLVETVFPGSAVDQVRNRPDLTNRPLVFSTEFLPFAGFRTLCQRGSVVLLTKDQFRLHPFSHPRPRRADADAAMAWLKRQDCFRPAAS